MEITEQRDKQIARAIDDAIKKYGDSLSIDTVAMLIGMYRLEIRTAVLKEAAERATRYIYDDIDCPMAFEMIQHILGDHAPTFMGLPVFDSQPAGPMLDLDPAVQGAVQKNFSELVDPSGSNELLKQRGVTFKVNMETCPPPLDVILDAHQNKLHVDIPGRRAVNAIKCATCAESVDGKPGNGVCQQCKEEESNEESN